MKLFFEQGPFGPEGVQKKDNEGPPVKYDYFFAFIMDPENNLLYNQHATVALERREPYVPHKVFTSLPPGQSMGNFDMVPVWKTPMPPSGQWPCDVPIPLGKPQYIPVRIQPAPTPSQPAYANELPVQQQDEGDREPEEREEPEIDIQERDDQEEKDEEENNEHEVK